MLIFGHVASICYFAKTWQKIYNTLIDFKTWLRRLTVGKNGQMQDRIMKAGNKH